jgi:Tfp pilus assembly protein PilO
MNKTKSIFSLLVILMVFTSTYWIYSALVVNRAKFNEQKQARIVAENNFNRLRTERANYSAIKQTRNLIVANFDTLRLNIPLKENSYGNNTYIRTLNIVRDIANQNNITINSFRPILVNTFPEINVKEKSINKRIERYIVELECHGDFKSIGGFFQELQNNERFINLLKFDIQTEFGIEGGLLCEVTLYTYVFSGNT